MSSWIKYNHIKEDSPSSECDECHITSRNSVHSQKCSKAIRCDECHIVEYDGIIRHHLTCTKSIILYNCH